MKVCEKPGWRALDHIVNKSTTVGERCWEITQSGAAATVSNKQRQFSAKAGNKHLCPNWNSCRVLSLLCHTAIPPTLASVSLAPTAASTLTLFLFASPTLDVGHLAPSAVVQWRGSRWNLHQRPPSLSAIGRLAEPLFRLAAWQRGGLAAPLFYVTFPARPEDLTNCTSNPVLHMRKIMYGITVYL